MPLDLVENYPISSDNMPHLHLSGRKGRGVNDERATIRQVMGGQFFEEIWQLQYRSQAAKPWISGWLITTGALKFSSNTEPPRRRGYLHTYHDWMLDFRIPREFFDGEG
jgi:hypothetical protein